MERKLRCTKIIIETTHQLFMLFLLQFLGLKIILPIDTLATYAIMHEGLTDGLPNSNKSNWVICVRIYF
jgi:hypothetical protein